ncbi:NAD(P)/FAD-dependent oxidoreductase [Geosporobacter ferrireducens]|uniref:NADH:ubiquinone reductase (non-electrogenic) n=1 Tax=Geosporobacter ferrireducens TaxID=1424294 RepID=A0A1D8GKW2_9FIRM|nr:NAD(P)/FAD-dependent oxidoreductase [Geosporobacter ferrireducens]AOT71549.1 hypothetical protein Gferi_19630 [Geosporobacter ferrireducens]
MTEIVVLGAGYAGIRAALTLHKRLKNEDVCIRIIDKHNRHTLLTELHEVAGNRVDEESVKIYLKDIFKYTQVKVIQDTITSIDFENQKLISERGHYTYNYLIIGCGSEPAYFNIDGMQEHAYTLWSLEDAKRIHKHVIDMFQAAADEKDPKKRSAYLTFIIGGGGFTGIEMMGELMQWIRILCKEYAISRKEVRLMVIEAMPQILAILDHRLITKAVSYLTKHGVEILTDSPIKSVASDYLQIKDGTIIDTRTLIWTGGIKGNDFITRLGLPVTNRGRIEVNQFTQSMQYKNIFFIGDNAHFVDEDGRVLPALVESAMQTGDAAALNIVRLIKEQPLESCKPKLHGVMVSIGRSYAVADVMGFKSSGIIAVFIKHMVNIHYQFEVAGFEQVIRYLSHQFLHKREDDHFLKEHFIQRSFTFFLVIMRMYLGYMWLIQGMNKLREGWLSKAVIYAERIGPTLPDAIANPSPPADTANEAVKQGLNLIGKYTPLWYAWILENIIASNALLFQTLIVITEIGLGIAFLTGTFTFIAALISIGMNINFIFSTGLYDYWYLVTSIACLGGAGRSFGVDHYLIPWFMRQWRYFIRNRDIKINLK